MTTCPAPNSEFHTAHLTRLGHLAYGPLRLYRVIPTRLVTRPCPEWKAARDLRTDPGPVTPAVGEAP